MPSDKNTQVSSKNGDLRSTRSAGSVRATPSSAPSFSDREMAELEKIVKAGCQKRSLTDNQEQLTLLRLFRFLDVDRSGGLSKAQFQRAMAHHCSIYDKKAADALFERYDVNHSGQLSYIEFVRGIYAQEKAWGIRSEETERQLRQVALKPASVPKHKLVDRSAELMLQIMPVHKKPSVAEIEREIRRKLAAKCASNKDEPKLLKRAFQFFDRSGDGLISANEFIDAIESIASAGLRHADVMQVFKHYDVDSSGKLSFEEFVRGLYPDANLAKR